MLWVLFVGQVAASEPPPSVEEAVALLERCTDPGQCDVPCWGDAKRRTEPGPDGALQAICMTGETPHGPVVAWYPNGSPLGVGYSLNGQPHGGAVSWHANGKRASESFWINGGHEGLLRTWHANGQLESQGEWKGNRQQGMVRFWYPSGQLDEASNWVDGVPDGPMFSWHENGKLRAKARFKMGDRVGAWRVWYPTGKRSVAVRYRDGKPKHLRCWDPKGKQMICPDGVTEVSRSAAHSSDLNAK